MNAVSPSIFCKDPDADEKRVSRSQEDCRIFRVDRTRQNINRKCFTRVIQSGKQILIPSPISFRCHHKRSTAIPKHPISQGRRRSRAAEHDPGQPVPADGAGDDANAAPRRTQRNRLHIPVKRRVPWIGTIGRATRKRSIRW
jgi:hypothetical protein